MCRAKKDGGIGFRDIGNFNQNLLAKLAWRLISVPNFLLSRVYKARYYAKKEAIKNNRPSYVWWSILYGRDLLPRGLMKNIGDGRDTHLWFDKWVFDETPRIPMNKRQMMDLNLKVSDLISPLGGWNSVLLSDLFPHVDVTPILSFTPNIAESDSLIWAYTKDGNYSVKSGNFLLSKAGSGFADFSLTLIEENASKSRLRAIKTVPKIKMFLWRVLSGALAVAECLNAHGLHTSLTCKVCNNAPETVA